MPQQLAVGTIPRYRNQTHALLLLMTVSDMLHWRWSYCMGGSGALLYLCGVVDGSVFEPGALVYHLWLVVSGYMLHHFLESSRPDRLALVESTRPDMLALS
eukprot:550984-Amorphochlora_amoeboformis.AAC.1